MNILRIIERVVLGAAIACVVLFWLLVLFDKNQQEYAHNSLKRLQLNVHLYENKLQEPLQRCASAARKRYQEMWLRKIIRSAETAWHAELQKRNSRPAIVQNLWAIILNYRRQLRSLQAITNSTNIRDCPDRPT